MSFKQTLVAAAFGLLFAGNALALDHGHFSGLSRGQMPRNVAAQSEAAPMTMASATSEHDFPAAAGAFTASATADAGSMVGSDALPVAGSLDLDGNFTTENSRLAQNVNVTPVPPRDWLLMLAVLGLVGVMVERTKRRAI